jgi:hypothetical protein
VNRREFLFAMGVVGCGARAAPRTAPRPSTDAGVDTPRQTITDDWSSPYQLLPSPLVVQGATVARITATELAFVDATTLQRTGGVPGVYRSACTAGGSALFAFTRANGPCAVERFDATTSAGSMMVPGSCTSEDGYRLVAAGSSLYLSRSDVALYVYRIASSTLEADGRIQLEDRARGARQLVGLGDGRLLMPVGRVIREYRGAIAQRELAAPARIAHLCTGATGRIWYSAWDDDHDRIARVVLAKLEPGLPTVATLATRVAHVASSPDGGAAVLTVDETGWSIIVLDDAGRERRRIGVPRELAVSGLGDAFVGLTAATVLLDTRSRGLFSWSLATGAPV